MEDQKSCLIVGCGDIGTRLSKLMFSKGFNVWGVRRNPDLLPSEIKPVASDITIERTFSDWPTCDYVVYCVAASERSDEGYRQAYVKGLSNLLGWLERTKQNTRRLLYVSSSRVYHQQHDEWVTETSETLPTGIGLRLLEAEQLLEKSDIPTTAVRFSGIYGPGREYLFKQVRAGYGVVGANDPYTNRIHQDDCAGILAYLIEQDNLGVQLASCYNGVDNHPARLSEVVSWLATQLNTKPTLPLSRASTSSKRCSNQRLIELGYQFKYPDYQAGYQEIINKHR
ncbi:NAD(P)H-binding protein [Endozoicomonas sp. SM1973]|uniref:NAD(P)H-binding protein n=1 Tax=Spartinivicinus marinus TaxID=2994442 RepID=A0A853IDH0_9GAMM|nr:NAD-dependent epimerase/dehydratase family protein [Spartinivicinus marinus]MCX4027259.1 NAD-dependent epimerase/dehydratase family protein [Spartinivicinus marinus]NYZ67981.1 NAD(P)H-binding protein [Spartinivicinus marinus]